MTRQRKRNPWEIDPTGWKSSASNVEGYYGSADVLRSPNGVYYFQPNGPSVGGDYEVISKALGEAWFKHFGEEDP